MLEFAGSSFLTYCLTHDDVCMSQSNLVIRFIHFLKIVLNNLNTSECPAGILPGKKTNNKSSCGVRSTSPTNLGMVIQRQTWTGHCAMAQATPPFDEHIQAPLRKI